jgi:Zn-dependent protease/CBS domain-containing protein
VPDENLGELLAWAPGVKSVKGRADRDALLPASLSLGRIAGIPIALHFSWFIIAALITFSLAARFAGAHPGSSVTLVWGVSILTAVLFFVSLVAHELSHALVARVRGIPVKSITLFALGGIANISKEANSAGTEFLIAIVGPITSFVIGFGAIGVAQSMGWTPDDGTSTITGSVLGWLGSINVLLAAFNLIPGYPLDGGRVLRSILWAIYKDGDRATRHAARVGQVVAGLFIAIGVFQAFTGAGIGGLWLAFIGWFLLTAAQAAHAQVSLTQLLRNVRVADIMASDCATVDERTSLRAIVDDLMLRTGQRCVMVQSDGRILGLLTPGEVRGVERSRWTDLTARDVMRPLDRLRTVTPDTAVSDALTTMARDDVNQLPVVDHGHLEGIVSRGQIMRLLQARSELGG